MRHHGRVDAAQRALVDQNYFAAAAFLGRSAEEYDTPRQFAGDALQACDGAERGACDQVVAARMAVGQRVVFGEDSDRGTLGAELCAKRRLESADFALDLESQLGRSLAQQAGGEMLLELELGTLVNFVAERDHLVAVAVDRAGYFGVSVHRRAPLDAVSIVSSTENSDYPTRRSARYRGVRKIPAVRSRPVYPAASLRDFLSGAYKSPMGRVNRTLETRIFSSTMSHPPLSAS